VRVSRLGAVVLIVATLVACGSSKKPAATRAADAVQKGLAAHVAGRVDEALAEYDKALKIEPNNTFALYNIGLIAQTRGDMAEAEKRYRAVLAIDPKFTSALFNLAIVRDGAGAPKEAIALYRRALQVTPNDANTHLNLGFALREVGQTADGDKELATAVRLDPKLVSRIPKSGGASPTAATGPSATRTASPSPTR
jgi:tetratricopeptide (TPR) repeat protein